MLKRFSNYVLFWEILLGLIWLAIIIIINPKGEFPLNDDWAYAKSVQHLVNTGSYILIDWPAMSLIAQIYWGGLFCSIFGFSFTVLRISTLLLGFIGVLYLFKFIYRLSNNRKLAFIGALLLMVNPLFVSLSFSFMTDVPFLVFCLLAIYCFFRHLQSKKNIPLILALIFSVVATLTRQMGFLVSFAFAIVYIATEKISVRLVAKAIVPFIISIASFSYYNHWLAVTNRMTSAYEKHGNIKTLLVQFIQPISDTVNFTFLRTGYAFLYVAIFLLPLLIHISPAILKKQKPLIKAIPFWMASVFMIVFFFFFKKNIGSPFTGNVLYNLGLGPKLLKDSYNLNLHVSPSLWDPAMITISIIGLAAMFFLMLALSDILVDLIVRIKNKALDLKWKTILFIYVVSIIYLGFLVFSYFFDRYFIFLVPVITFVLLLNYGNKITFKANWVTATSIMFFIIIGWFSVSATHDYLSWNRARWKALDYLTNDKKVTPQQIDGGFEFNCWHQAGWWRPVDDIISWWCVTDDEYIVSFGRIAKYKTIRKFHYSSMIPCNDNNIYLLQRDTLTPEIITCDLEQFTVDKKNFTTSSREYQIPTTDLLSSEKSHSGKYSLKFAGKDTYGLQFALKHVVPGDLIEIQIWKLAKENDIKIVANSLYDNKFHFASKDAESKSADAWEPLLLKFYVPKEVKEGIAIYLWSLQNNISYVDDLTVKIYHMN